MVWIEVARLAVSKVAFCVPTHCLIRDIFIHIGGIWGRKRKKRLIRAFLTSGLFEKDRVERSGSLHPISDEFAGGLVVEVFEDDAEVGGRTEPHQVGRFGSRCGPSRSNSAALRRRYWRIRSAGGS